VNIFPILI